MGTPAELFDPRCPRRCRLLAPLLLCVCACLPVAAQFQPQPSQSHARRFLSGRTLPQSRNPAAALAEARVQHLQLLTARSIHAQNSPLNAQWQPIGPVQIASLAYGDITGRVTSIAIDPADPTGNTVYLGTTGGGVWKSTNAAGPAAGVTFTPLTDTLPVFGANGGAAVIPSLSIGALAINSGVLLAGTGDPNDASDSYYGSGILRSADGGLTWTLINQSHDGSNGTHSFAGLGFAGFAFSTATPTLVVAALSQSAEGTLVNAPDTLNSVMGLYYSTDSGVTWQMASIYDGSQTVQQPQTSGANQGGNAATAVVWNPIRQRFYAAIRYHGYYESTDGITWSRLAHQPGAALTLAACPTNPGLPGNPACPIFRGALAVQPITGDTFAISTDRNNLDQGLYQDTCAHSSSSCASPIVTFSSRLPSTPLEAGGGATAIPQADYNLTLSAVPAGADTLLFAGTIDLYRCTLASGCTLRNTTNATNACAAPAQVAPAQHAIATLATSGISGQPLVYLGNDGGLWRSTDGVNQQLAPCSPDDATHFQNLNGGLGSLAEVVSFAQHPIDPATLLVALGANGTAAATSNPATTPWPQLTTGEGGTVAIDPVNPLLWYVSTAAGVSLRQCPNGPACTAADFTGPPAIGAPQVWNDDSLIDAPALLDPALTSSVLLGTCRVWRGPAADGALWSSSYAISKLLGGPQNQSCTTANPAIRSLAAAGPSSNAGAANAGSQVLYAGMAGALDGGFTSGGHLFSTTSAQTASNSTPWTDLALSSVTNDFASAHKFNPGGFDISSIAADPHDATGATLYVTVMGFAGNGTNAPHLYRSINGGANWFNISSNLPNAPANSVAIDPNDANTLYVALDTGIYVTTNVTSCTSSNCWSAYGSGLPNAPVTQLLAGAALPTGDGRIGELRAATYGRGIWQIPLLTAALPAQPAIALSATALTFATQAIATISPAQTITVTNSGNAPLAITQLLTTGDFHATSNCTSGPIATNQTCAIQVTFLPSATGTRTGLLTVYGTIPGGQATANLSGTGAPPAIILLDPVALTFPSTTIGASPIPQSMTVSNTGGLTATLQPIVVTGDFHLSANTCGPTLSPGTGCTIAISFTPTASGARTGTLTLTDTSGTQTSTQTAALSGTGTSPATDTLTATSVAFSSQPLSTPSAPQQVTIINAGDEILTLISAQATGDFIPTNSCGSSLAAHSTCSIGVAFQPRTVGLRIGTLTISDAFRSQTVSLTGTGIAPPGVSLSPALTLGFPNTAVATSSAPQIVTVTNNSLLALTLSAPALTGDFSLALNTDTCPATLAPASSCTLQLLFTPTASGPRTGTFILADSAPNSPQTLTLTGTAIDFTLTPDGPTALTIANGQSAVYPLLLTSSANVPGIATFACTGVPANATCNITPATIALGTTTVVTVTLDTGVTSTASSSIVNTRSLLFAVLAPLGLLFLPRRSRTLARLAVLCLLITATGCGSGRAIPPGSGTDPPPSAITPPGTYPISITASSSGRTRTVTLTLTVQ